MWTVLSKDNQALYHTDKEPNSGNYIRGKRTIGMYWDGFRMVPSLPNVVTERKKKAVREQRDRLLNESDWVFVRARELGQDVPREWLDYRRDLRQIPEQPGFPDNVNWPTKPE